MKELLKTILGSSPKTTLIGFAEAAVIAAYPIFIEPNFTWKKDGIILLVAVCRAIYGRISKDSNGLTAAQSQEVHQDIKMLVDPTGK